MKGCWREPMAERHGHALTRAICRTLREDYDEHRKEKSRLLNEARRRSTRLARKVLIRKLAHPAKLSKPKPKRGVSYESGGDKTGGGLGMV